MQPISRSVLLFLMLGLLSACGGGDGDTSVPTVSLTVALIDILGTGSPSGHQIQITDGGDIDFTCFQITFQNQPSDSRCDTEAAGNNQTGGSAIIFRTLPTGRSYTLKDALAGDDTILETCTVNIQTTTTLVAESPCHKISQNRIQLDIDPTTP